MQPTRRSERRNLTPPHSAQRESRSKFRSYRSVKDLPETSSTSRYRSRSPIKIRKEKENPQVHPAYDHYLTRLTKEVFPRSKASNYRGNDHLLWVKDLFYTMTRDEKPTPRIQNYIDPLFSNRDSIKSWDIQVTIKFFILLTKLKLFDQIKSLDSNSRVKVEKLHHVLIEKITKDLNKLAITKYNLYDFNSLLWAATHSLDIESSTSRLATSIGENFLNYQAFLSINEYKEIAFHLNKFVKFKSCFYVLNKLTEKHLSEIIQIKYSSRDNDNHSKYLFFIENILRYNDGLDHETKKHLKKLIKRINFKSNLKTTSMGLFSIMQFISKKKLSLTHEIKKTLDEGFSFIEKNKRELSLADCLSISHSILKYFTESGDNTNSELQALLDLCLHNISINKYHLSPKQIITSFDISEDLYLLSLPTSNLFKITIDAMLHRKQEIIEQDSQQIFAILNRLANVLRASLASRSSYYLSILKPMLDQLMARYSNYILHADMFTQCKSFHSSSSIVNKGYCPNSNSRDLMRSLSNSLEKKSQTMETKHFIDFFRSINNLGNLIHVDRKYYLDLLSYYTDKALEEQISISRKLSFIWSIYAFYAARKEKLTETNISKLKQLSRKLYNSIEDKSQIKDLSYYTVLMVENWLGIPNTRKIQPIFSESQIQKQALKIIKNELIKRGFKEEVVAEYSMNFSLPPCDIAIPAKKIMIEIQGKHHFIDREQRYKTGSTLVKNQLYKDSNCHLVEIPVLDQHVATESIQESVDKIIAILEESKKPKFS